MRNTYSILIATDYSEASGVAESYAVKFAKKTNSSILFLHVFPPPLSIPLDTFYPEKEDYNPFEFETDRLRDHVKRKFGNLLIDGKKVEYKCFVREGNVEKQVLLEAKESDIDFIFIGTHGASGFREKLFGSNTWKIIKNSDVPVISIPKDAHAFTEIKRIVFATEYREGEIPVINYLTKFAKQFNAEVIVLHISSHILSKEHEKELYDKFRAEVKNEISYKNIDMHFTYHDNIIEGLNNFCVRTKTDLLVMSPEKPFFLEKIFNPSASITKKASYNTHIPLLTIPDFYNPVYAGFWKMFEQGDQYWNEDL